MATRKTSIKFTGLKKSADIRGHYDPNIVFNYNIVEAVFIKFRNILCSIVDNIMCDK